MARWRLVLFTCALTLTASAPALAQGECLAEGDDLECVPEREGEEDATDIERKKERRNAFGFGFAHSFHLLRDRTSPIGEDLKDTEHMWGFLIAYERILIENHLALVVAKSFYFNSERFDSPLDVGLKALFRRKSWEPFIAVGVSQNLRVFEKEREKAEGEGLDWSIGPLAAVGVTYFINPRWAIVLEFAYAFVPNSDVVEHEFTDALRMGYFF